MPDLSLDLPNLSRYANPMMSRRADIFAAMERTGTRRGGLREWMRKNHDAFAEKLRTVRPNWDLLAEVFAKAELTDQRGNLPQKGETVRKNLAPRSQGNATTGAAGSPQHGEEEGNARRAGRAGGSNPASAGSR